MAGNLNNWPVPSPGRLLLQVGVFCCAIFTPAQLAMAGAGAPYGEYFVRLGESWPDAGAVATLAEPPDDSAARDGASFETQVGRLEEAGGPYADTLAEPLTDMARLYHSSGDIQAAQRSYLRALHVVRINEGLYSERQVPILRELFQIYRMSGDLATLDARYDYFFRLYGNGLPPYTAVRISAALEYLRWQREALRLGLDEQNTQRLLALYSLNERMLASAADDPTVDFADYRGLVLSQVRNLYLLQDRYQPQVQPVNTVSITRMPEVWDEKDANQQRLETFQRNALARGRVLLEGLINRTPPAQVEELAAAWLELGDWNQWNDRRTEALDAYIKVERLLRDAGLAGLLQQWLGQAVELPANGAFWQPRPDAGNREPIVVQARYDVSARGRADNIEATALAGEYESKAGKVRRNLAQTRFRPRIVNGEPGAEKQVQRDYEVMK